MSLEFVHLLHGEQVRVSVTMSNIVSDHISNVNPRAHGDGVGDAVDHTKLGGTHTLPYVQQATPDEGSSTLASAPTAAVALHDPVVKANDIRAANRCQRDRQGTQSAAVSGAALAVSANCHTI
jgi:hypothetical protein